MCINNKYYKRTRVNVAVECVRYLKTYKSISFPSLQKREASFLKNVNIFIQVKTLYIASFRNDSW